jgi:hypothetical protein
MDPQRIEFAQRHENESALMESRVRDDEFRLVDDSLSVE